MSDNIIVALICPLWALALVAFSYKFIEANGGRDVKIHALYWIVAVTTSLLIPSSVGQYVFSSLTVSYVGCLYPVYRATKAVCTTDEEDDKEWLQYWMLGGVLFCLTTWVDDVMADEKASTVWMGVLSFAFFWLYFPKTCGALVVYERFTEPVLGPRLQPMQKRVNNFASFLFQSVVNAVHLCLLWVIFMILPNALKRTVAIAVGTVYPFICSAAAVATDEIEDDTYWLTYWAVFGCLFFVMTILETWFGWIPGFYTAFILCTLYLMLPMFRGADKVFRKILVPLAGLQEMMILRDSMLIKKQMTQDLHPERAALMKKTISEYFGNDDEKMGNAAVKEELVLSWKTKIMNKFGRHDKKDAESVGDSTKGSSLL